MPPTRRQRKTPPAAGETTVAVVSPVRSGPILETEQARPEVIRLLAGGGTNRAIARQFGCNPASVGEFKFRHKEEIDRLREQLRAVAVEETGLWIADKVRRVEVLQDQADQLLTALDTATVDTMTELTNTLVRVLHEAAEQLGQLPSRPTVQLTQQIINYRFTGVDMGAL